MLGGNKKSIEKEEEVRGQGAADAFWFIGAGGASYIRSWIAAHRLVERLHMEEMKNTAEVGAFEKR